MTRAEARRTISALKMNVALLHPGMRLPDSRETGPSGLVAIGGDLHPETLIDAYSKGAFPWFEEEPILWFSPDPRLVLRPAELRIGRSIRRALKREEFAGVIRSFLASLPDSKDDR